MRTNESVIPEELRKKAQTHPEQLSKADWNRIWAALKDDKIKKKDTGLDSFD